jgi:hypothetical protein
MRIKLTDICRKNASKMDIEFAPVAIAENDTNSEMAGTVVLVVNTASGSFPVAGSTMGA